MKKTTFSIKKHFLFLIFSFIFFYFPTVVSAGTDNIMFNQYCGSNTNNSTAKICGSRTTWFSRYDYTDASAKAVVWGHRHSNSSDIYVDICIIPYGSCWSHTYSAGEIGTLQNLSTHPQTPLTDVPWLYSENWYNGSFQIYTYISLQDAEAWITGQGYANYYTGPPPPPPPTTVDLNFHVHANCSGENIQNANILLAQNYGGGTSVNTDANGNATIQVTPDTNISWFASQPEYSSGNGVINSGSGGQTQDVTLLRDCAGSPPPPPPNVCSDPAATNYGASSACTYPTACTDNAIVNFINPSTTAYPGEVKNYTFQVLNTGDTWWYHGFVYQIWQTAGAAISGIPSQMGSVLPNESSDVYSISITAPSVVGTYPYSLKMQHTDFGGSKTYGVGPDCAVAPSPYPGTNFGTAGTVNLVVSNPTVTTSAALTNMSGTPVTSVQTDGTTQYKIVVTATDTAGATRLNALDWIINYQGANGDGTQGKARGAGKWILTNAYTNTTTYPTASGYKDHMACGTGSAIIWAGWGSGNVHLVSCTSSDSGNTKVVTYVVTFLPAFTNPTFNNPTAGQGNDISSFASDQPTGAFAGWLNNDLNFGLNVAPASGTLSGPATCTIVVNGSTCSVTLNWTLSNPVSVPTTIVGNGTVTVSNSLTASQSGSQSVTVPGGNQSYSLVNNGITLASASVTSSCASGTSWNGTICTANPTSTVTLSISTNPSPKGYVSSSVGGINCGTISGTSYSTCSATFAVGSTTALTASPASSYWQFTGWVVANSSGGANTGECAGTGVCTLTISIPKFITAVFVPRPFTIIEF